MPDVLQYSGKRVIVTGAASGIGAATAQILVELGAEVHTIDIDKPELTGLASFTEADLRDPDQIHRAVAKIGKIINALFNCAALPDTSPGLDLMLVNFCGRRALTEAVIPLMIEGSAIACTATSAARGRTQNRAVLSELLATPDFAAAQACCEAHPDELGNAYDFSAEAINAYTAQRSLPLAADGIRINCVNSGPADTPLGRPGGVEEQAWPMVFLNSPRASFVTGLQFDADGGFTGAVSTGRIAPEVRGE